MQKRIALLYDFDYTLAKGYMQQFGFMQEFGYDNIMDFFKTCEEVSLEKDMDQCLSFLCGVNELATRHNKVLTRDYLRKFGKDVEYFDGVEEWFEKINAIGREYGYEIEHYVVSSGLKEMIEGTTIAKYFKRIYANFYAYKDGVAFWPAQVVNYTSKTQYIYRVRKNVLDDLGKLDKINEKMADSEVLPFKNIIYLGDSETDIPSFKVVKNSGGMSICVYDERSEKSKKTAQKCFIEGRVNYFTPANYSENSDLYSLVKNYIKNIANKN